MNLPPQLPPLQPNEFVTWVRVEREVFDLVGVILTSLGFTGLCVAFGAFFGLALGAAKIIAPIGKAFAEAFVGIKAVK